MSNLCMPVPVPLFRPGGVYVSDIPSSAACTTLPKPPTQINDTQINISITYTMIQIIMPYIMVQVIYILQTLRSYEDNR